MKHNKLNRQKAALARFKILSKGSWVRATHAGVARRLRDVDIFYDEYVARKESEKAALVAATGGR